MHDDHEMLLQAQLDEARAENARLRALLACEQARGALLSYVLFRFSRMAEDPAAAWGEIKRMLEEGAA